MPSIRRRHNHFEAKVRVPASAQERVGKAFLYRTFSTSDLRVAKAEAAAWEASLRLEWVGGGATADTAHEARRSTYADTRRKAEDGGFTAQGYEPGASEAEQGIALAIDKLADATGQGDLSAVDEARLHALQDASRTLQGLQVETPPAYEAIFLALSEDYLKVWRAQHGLGRRLHSSGTCLGTDE